MAGLGDFSVELTKPLGIILEEIESGTDNGVKVKSLVADGNAAISKAVSPGDVVLQVGDTDVSSTDFDSVMDRLIAADSPVTLTLSDGLGTMDIAANLAKTLEPEEAMYADAVVRAAVRQVRAYRKLGDLVRVEIVIGAAVRKDQKCLVRFFGIFSTDGVTTYSCNVSATGIRRDDGSIEIVVLSCAKDEGLGQTVDIINEKSS